MHRQNFIRSAIALGAALVLAAGPAAATIVGGSVVGVPFAAVMATAPPPRNP